MVKNSTDLFEPLRKRGMQCDAGFLREVLQALV